METELRSGFYTRTRVDLPEHARALAIALSLAPDWLRLRHIGLYDVPREPFDIERAVELLTGTALKRTRGPSESPPKPVGPPGLTAYGRRRRRGRFLQPDAAVYVLSDHSFWHTFNRVDICPLYIREPEPRRFKEVVTWCSLIFDAVAGDYAWLCSAAEEEARNLLKVRDPVFGGIGTSPRGNEGIDRYLPGIYWANLFGSVHLDFFGRDHFAAAPWFELRQLKSGGILALTCAEPAEWDSAETRERQQRILRHLGDDCFFDIVDGGKPTRAPVFDFSGIRRGTNPSRSDRLLMALRDAAGDGEDFVAQVLLLAGDFRRGAAHPDRLDFSPQSLKELDRELMRARRRGDPFDDIEVVRRMSAYYGEVLRRACAGRWQTVPVFSGESHNALEFLNEQPAIAVDLGEYGAEFPLVRVLLAWVGKRPTPKSMSALYCPFLCRRLSDFFDMLMSGVHTAWIERRRLTPERRREGIRLLREAIIGKLGRVGPFIVPDDDDGEDAVEPIPVLELAYRNLVCQLGQQGS